jgi:hypothetical protein
VVPAPCAKIGTEPLAILSDLLAGLKLSGGRHRMTALARVLARAFPTVSPGGDILKSIVLFCAACLFVALVMATYGLDLSVGFF